MSISCELHLLMKAVAGVRVLAERSVDSPHDAEALAHSISALLMVVEERLRLVDRATRDAIDPSLAWCEGNAALPATDEGDLVLVGWSEKKRARRVRKR